MTSPPDAPPEFTVAVRVLCAFTARRGDLDARFGPSPSAQQGIEGHSIVTARRGAGYQRERALEAVWQPPNGAAHGLRVRGRADGWDPAAGRLEEIKTHRGRLDRLPENLRALHWAQARIYGHLLCVAEDRATIELALVYFDIGTTRETLLTEPATAGGLQAFFDECCAAYLHWAQQEASHRVRRDAALGGLSFPHAAFRTGQRELATATYNAARSGRKLLAQAPTGIGKTVGTVFPALKAVPVASLDRVVFLAAKATGRPLALDALDTVLAASADGAGADDPAPVRVLDLVARDKACEHPDKACHGESCPLAAGFHDRLPAARRDAVRLRRLDLPALRRVAAAHALCPYHLGQEMTRWADVVVADYHHWFDTHALVHALSVENGWRTALLVDEAHNLVDRARGMYGATLDPGTLAAARAVAQSPALAPIKRALSALSSAWRRAGEDASGETSGGIVLLDDLPANFGTALQKTVATLAEHLADEPRPPGDALLSLHFELLGFTRLVETFGAHSVFEIDASARDAGATGAKKPRLPALSIRNLIPAPFLAPRFADAHSATLFSATLTPRRFHEDLLGLGDDTAWIDVASPFHAAQLDVRVARHISTRWADRARSVRPIAELIARQFDAAPGNYLAFFSSHDYLEQIRVDLARRSPHLPLAAQARRMSEPERQAFIDAFEAGGRRIGMAVLGGSFAEGIDLPGDRLVGAFVATLGLPQVNPLNERAMARMQSSFEATAGASAGWDYAYLVPGLRKVVQAAGRVIRTQQDRGTVHLIDDRFARPTVRALLPSWWRMDDRF